MPPVHRNPRRLHGTPQRRRPLRPREPHDAPESLRTPPPAQVLGRELPRRREASCCVLPRGRSTPDDPCNRSFLRLLSVAPSSPSPRARRRSRRSPRTRTNTRERTRRREFPLWPHGRNVPSQPSRDAHSAVVGACFAGSMLPRFERTRSRRRAAASRSRVTLPPKIGAC